MYTLRHSPDDTAVVAPALLDAVVLKGEFMANRETDRNRRPGQTSSTDDDMVRGRADEMEDMGETDEFEDTEDIDEDEDEEEGESNF
jgi:hypothetical protein